MARVCARPLCAEVATVRFWFNGETRHIVLDRKVDEWGGSGVLCELHADRLTVPRSWELDDRRVTAPRLFPVPPSPGRLAPVTRARKLIQPEAHPSTPLPLDGGPTYALPPDYVDAPDNAGTSHGGDAGTSNAGEDGDARDVKTKKEPNRATKKRRTKPRPSSGASSGEAYDQDNEDVRDESSDGHEDHGDHEVDDDRDLDHPDQRTPLLARAFDQASSRVRDSSTLDSLFPRSART